MASIIPLKTVVYDYRARNGTWCCHPYHGHPKGCPNFVEGCTAKRPDFVKIEDLYNWFAVVELFDLKTHAEKMKAKHPDWSEQQCRNLLYWQGTVRANLRRHSSICTDKEDIILDIPEACGINVFETMKYAGITIDKKPDIVVKVMLVGRRKK